ncbi:MAG: TIGR03545 family protein [Planctomycetota bacterium]
MKRLFGLAGVFRWGYLAPRLGVVLAGLCVIELGAGWVVKQAIRAAGEPAVGARINLAKSRATVLGSRIELAGLQVANPDAPMTNLVEADAIDLDLDGALLLRKRAVIKRGSVRGLRFGTARVASGELPDLCTSDDTLGATAPGARWAADAAGDKAKAWLENLGQRFTADPQEQFQAPQVARDLRDKWLGEYDQLEALADQIKADSKRLTDQVAEAKKNPLRNAEFLRGVPSEITALREKFRELYARADALPGLIEADRERVAAARRHDEQLLRESLAVSEIDTASLTAYLIGEEVAGPMNQLVGWLRWARRMAPAKIDAGQATRSRGVDVLFGDAKPPPNLLVKTLDLSGTARLAGRPVELSGVLTDFTPQPTRHDQPLRLALNATGALPLRVRATIDRTGATPRDELLADCQGIALPEMKLGGGRWLGLTVGAGPATLNVSLLLEGDTLSGDVQLVQQQVRVQPTRPANPSSRAAPLREALAGSLRRLPTIATRVDLGGTLDNPDFKLWSNLGPAVAQAMESAVRDAVNQQSERLLAASQQEVDKQLAGLTAEVTAARSKLQPLLGGLDESIEQVATQLTGGNPFSKLGRMPAGLLK